MIGQHLLASSRCNTLLGGFDGLVSLVLGVGSSHNWDFYRIYRQYDSLIKYGFRY